jgi:hypothetical protein
MKPSVEQAVEVAREAITVAHTYSWGNAVYTTASFLFALLVIVSVSWYLDHRLREDIRRDREEWLNLFKPVREEFLLAKFDKLEAMIEELADRMGVANGQRPEDVSRQ